MSPRRHWRLPITLVVIALAFVVISILRADLTPPPVPTPVATPAALSPAERAYYDAVSPPLRAAAAEARALTELGQARSRNLLTIRAGQSRLQEQLAAIDAALATAPVPDRLAPALNGYPDAAITIRQAIRAAEGGFIRFDWDAVGAATEQMATGTSQLEAASRALDVAAGVLVPGTPLATPPSP